MSMNDQTIPISSGHLHPLTLTIRHIVGAIAPLGFEVILGPEKETEYYNFDALNVPKNHPARDMQDTFWIKGVTETVLRTHTSAVQARHMEYNHPPFRILVPGKVFRHEATDATHVAQFYQVEGLAVDKNISLADLKGTLLFFLKDFFGEDITMRLRPSFFPFVEPGAEIDIGCFKCSGKGCGVCKQTGWIEILGAGMVHPNVLNIHKIDPRKWRGFAFGLSVDRLIMLKYGVPDIRLLYSGDLRVVNQF